MSAEFQVNTDSRTTQYKFFEPGGILFSELGLLSSDDKAFETARDVSRVPRDELKKQVVPMIEGLEDDTFAVYDRQNFLSLRLRDPEEESPEFQTHVGKILQNWNSYLPPEKRINLPPDEIVEFTKGLGFREELAFRLYRIRQFSRKHTSLGISYWELKKDPRWEEISKGLDDGAVLCLLAMRYITQ